MATMRGQWLRDSDMLGAAIGLEPEPAIAANRPQATRGMP
jgi:hypothetical protein